MCSSQQVVRCFSSFFLQAQESVQLSVCVCVLSLHYFLYVLASTGILACKALVCLCVHASSSQALRHVCLCMCVCVCVVWIGSVQPGMFSNTSYKTDQGSYTGLSSVEMYEKKWFYLRLDRFGYFTETVQKLGERTTACTVICSFKHASGHQGCFLQELFLILA